MKFTPEQVIEMALEADGGFSADHINVDSLTRLCTLAADRALEAAAHASEAQIERWVDDRARYAASECATAIRAMKEQQ